MPSVWVVWSRSERTIVPRPDTYYNSSADATAAIRRHVKNTGNPKDKQNNGYDVVQLTVN